MNANGIHDQLLAHHHPDLSRNSESVYERPNLSSRRPSNSAGRQATLQIRASNLVRKIGILTTKLGAGARFKQSSTSDTKSDANLRKARSMDILRSEQPYMLASFESQPFVRNSTDGSKESENDASDSKFGHARNPSSSNSIAHGLAVAAMVAGAGVRPPAPLTSPSSPLRSADLSNSGNSTTTELNTGTRSGDTFEPLAPPVPEKRPAHPRLSTLPPLNFNLKGMSQDQRSQRLSPSVIVRPPPFPILELPALPTPVAQTPAPSSHPQSHRRQSGARLNSMPLLPREGSDGRENDPDHENCVLDEDEEGDDEDNDEDGTSAEADAAGSEDEDDETGPNGRRSRSRTSFSNVPPSPTSSFLSRTRGLSPRLTLSGLNTPTLSTLLNLTGGTPSRPQSRVDITSANPSHLRPGSVAVGNVEAVTDSRDDASTPKAARSNHIWGGMGNGSAQTDYFLISGADNSNLEQVQGKSQGIDPTLPSSDDNINPPSLSSTSSSLRTPTAHDYPAFRTPMIAVARPETAPSGAEVRAFNGSGFKPKGLVSDAEVPQLGLKGPLSKRRPSFYHHASKSMIELFSVAAQTTEPAAEDAVGRTASDRDVKGKGKLAPEALLGENLQSLTTEDDTLRTPRPDRDAKGQDKPLPPVTPTSATQSDGAPSLRRQRSMPTFGTAGEPPPYPSFIFPYNRQKPMPLPREDEGREELPPYSNSIRLEAIMPRKMEFAAPGLPARDRKWRRVHCILEGTAFRVYDCPPRMSGVGALGGWWERKVGVGDVSGSGVTSGTSAGPGATTNIIISRKEPKRRMKWEEELAAQEEAQATAGSGTEGGRSRASTPTPEANEHPKEHKSKRRVVAHLLHPKSSRHSLDHGSSSTPASPRSSFHFPRSSAESSSNPPSARPSMDLSTTAVSSSSTGNSASSSSLSAISNNSGVSTPGAQMRRRGHLRSDSAQSRSSCGHSRSNSRAHSPLNPDSSVQESHSHSHSQSQTQTQDFDPTINPYLYHPPDYSESPGPDEKDLLRVYTLQKCESGLASDYIKRKNVVRVRMEGEQFLLQCKDVPSVVEWIESFQAATNIAPDLDERPMPKGPIFPRRRRRRRPQPSAPGTEQPSADSGNGSSERAGTS